MATDTVNLIPSADAVERAAVIMSTGTSGWPGRQRLDSFEASDDGMAPLVKQGDRIYFDPFEQPPAAALVDRAVYALDLDGEAMIRRVSMTAARVRLQPDNPDFASIDLTPAEAKTRGLWIAGRPLRRPRHLTSYTPVAAIPCFGSRGRLRQRGAIGAFRWRLCLQPCL
jgi:hypothetical protein